MLLSPALRRRRLFEHSAQGCVRSFRQGLAGGDVRRVGKLPFGGCRGKHDPGQKKQCQAPPIQVV